MLSAVGHLSVDIQPAIGITAKSLAWLERPQAGHLVYGARKLVLVKLLASGDIV
jgi:hypothetical protein